jgi:ppGpp synthetase/RelA/SpoT-type nucleotidyltranferase
VLPPISRNQLKKLTQRLRDGTETPEDLHALADVRLYYRQVLERAHAVVASLCADTQHVEPMAPRVKTLKTTMEKLHRQPELHSLAQIRDLAGLRVVVHGTRLDQDDVVAQIGAALADDGRPPKQIDRRADPRSGYRAVHLEVRRVGILIEVQVRTSLQHRWAELFERTADRLGRGLRYDEPRHLTPDAARFVGALGFAAEQIDAVETLVALTGPDVPEQVNRMRAEIERFLELSADYLEQLS